MCRIRLQHLRLFALFLLPLIAFGQGGPRIGIIDIYGARRTSVAEVRKVLGLKEGSQLSGSKGAIEERLEEIGGVVAARIEAACCAGGNVVMYVGIQEKGAPTFEYRTPPAEDVRLPAEIHDTYVRFLDAVRLAGRSAQPAEDLTRGHSLMSDAAVRDVQLSFVPLANTHLEQLRSVIRRSEDAEQRAIAAYVIAYADDKASVVNDVQYAIQDIDDTVRSNAVRALAGLSVLATKDPQSGVKVSPTWLIEMLNSVTWTDRNNAAIALVTLTETRDAGLLDHIRERALPSLVEMARWKHLPHALPPYILLGRVAGIPEKELQDAWSRNQREAIVRRAASSGKR